MLHALTRLTCAIPCMDLWSADYNAKDTPLSVPSVGFYVGGVVGTGRRPRKIQMVVYYLFHRVSIAVIRMVRDEGVWITQCEG